MFYRSVGLDREDAWIEWYDYHHYMVMQMPGWTWARMYHALIGEEKYLALYRVEDYKALEQVYGWPDVEAGRTEVIEHQLHPALRADWAEKQKRGFADTGQFMFNGGARKDTGHWGWQQLAGSTFDDPLLVDNRHLGMEMVAVPEADAARWSEWYGKERFPALLELPGVVAGGWFGITTEGWDEEPRYRYMTLFRARRRVRRPQPRRPGPPRPRSQGLLGRPGGQALLRPNHRHPHRLLRGDLEALVVQEAGVVGGELQTEVTSTITQFGWCTKP